MKLIEWILFWKGVIILMTVMVLMVSLAIYGIYQSEKTNRTSFCELAKFDRWDFEEEKDSYSSPRTDFDFFCKKANLNNQRGNKIIEDKFILDQDYRAWKKEINKR